MLDRYERDSERLEKLEADLENGWEPLAEEMLTLNEMAVMWPSMPLNTRQKFLRRILEMLAPDYYLGGTELDLGLGDP